MAKKKTTNRDKQIDKKFEDLKKEIKKIVKEKSILNSERVGKKIDAIIDDSFVRELRGNGSPGVFERLRCTKEEIEEIKKLNKKIKGNGEIGVFEQLRHIDRQIKRIKITIFVMMIIFMGGSYFGVTGEKIKEKLGIKINNIKEKEDIKVIIDKIN